MNQQQRPIPEIGGCPQEFAEFFSWMMDARVLPPDLQLACLAHLHARRDVIHRFRISIEHRLGELRSYKESRTPSDFAEAEIAGYKIETLEDVLLVIGKIDDGVWHETNK